MTTSIPADARSELAQALWSLRRVFLVVGAFSMFVNAFMLVPSIYMMQVYDRVLASRSDITLLMLTGITLGAYGLLGVIERVRSELLIRASLRLDEQLHGRVFSAAFAARLAGAQGNAAQALQDLATLRQFLTGNGLFALFDAPWAPLFLLVITLLHPLLGLVSLVGAVLLVGLAIANEKLTGASLAQAHAASIQAGNYAAAQLHNAQTIEAMGMLPRVQQRWYARHRQGLALQQLASDRAAFVTAASRFVRLALQSLILGAGALLVIEDNMTGGGMIAASILMGRALSPVEQAIAMWKSFGGARAAYARLQQLLAAAPVREAGMALPAPQGHVLVEQVVAGAPGSPVAILQGLSFQIRAGEMVAIIGPSASGKSTLARLLVGVWPVARGHVRLDGADVYAWDKTQLGAHVGYLPQEVELLEGTVAENIARLQQPDPDQVVQAAQCAGVHEMILRLPKGYDTPVGPGGSVLSGGQRQRIALARALYGSPRLLVLDEPNSNLDDAGEAALLRAVQSARAGGATVVLITHRRHIVGAADRILVLHEGKLQLYGPRDEVLQALDRNRQAPPKAAAQAAPIPMAVQ